MPNEDAELVAEAATHVPFSTAGVNELNEQAVLADTVHELMSFYTPNEVLRAVSEYIASYYVRK